MIKVARNILSPYGRIGRKQFFAYFCAALIIYAATIFSAIITRPAFIFIIPIGFACWIYFSSIIKRLRDIGYSGVWLISWSVLSASVIIIFIFFIPRNFYALGPWLMFQFDRSWDKKGGIHNILQLLKHVSRAGNFENKGSQKEEEVFFFIIRKSFGFPKWAARRSFIDFKAGDLPTFTPRFHARRILGEPTAEPKMLTDIVGMLMAMANANGSISKEKLALVDEVIAEFGVLPPLPVSVPEIVGLAAKLAKADGRVAEEEVSVIDDFLRYGAGLTDSMRREAVTVFKRAKDDRRPFTSYADAFADVAVDELQKELAFRVLLDIALSDGALHEKEIEILEYVAKSFGIAHDFESQRSSKRGENNNNRKDKKQSNEDNQEGDNSSQKNEHYYSKILGIEPGADKSTIKKAFAAQQQKNHPDKVMHMSEAIRKFANDELVKINEAYEFFKKAGRV